MARYEVKVRVFDVEEETSGKARARVDQALREAGIRRSRIVRVRNSDQRLRPSEQRLRMPSRRQRQRIRAVRRRDPNVGSVALVAATIAWWLYILWAMV